MITAANRALEFVSTNTLTYIEPIQIPLDGGERNNLGNNLSSQVYRIYGISTIVQGVTPDNQQLIVPGDELNLYLSLKRGSNIFFETFRFSQFTFQNQTDPTRFFPVDIGSNFDLLILD